MRRRPRLFYGWLIVLVSALGLFLGAPLLVFSFSVFFKPLVEGFHASRAAVSFAFSLFNFIGALWLPFTGLLIDRFGAKRVILVSTVVFGVVLCSALWVGSGIWQLYLFFCMLGIAMTSGAAPVPFNAVVSHWFDRRRGLALALSMTGIGLGSIIVPILSQHLIRAYSWRTAFAIFGAAVLLLPTPAIAAFLKDDPAQLGLQPDGDTLPAGASPTQNTHGLTWHEIWHTPTFWLLLCIFSLAGASVHGVVLHLSAILTDRGITPDRAALATAIVGTAVISGRVVTGYLLDFIFAPRVAMIFYGATTLGIAMLSTNIHGPLVFIAAFLAGLGMGAEVETMGYMVSRYFGLRAFGRAYGVAFGAFMTAGSAAVLLMGAGYDHFRSYTPTLIALAVSIFAAVILLTRLGPYRFGVEPRPSEPPSLQPLPPGHLEVARSA